MQDSKDLKEKNVINKAKGLNLFGQFLLLTSTIVWGSSFIILKDAISGLPAMYVIGIRFLSSSLLLGLIFFGKIRKLNVKVLRHGLVLGLVLAAAYLTQTYGLKFISAGKNAFITSLYCVLCPFMLWFIFGAKPKAYNILSAVLCMVGIGLVALSGKSESDDNLFLGSVLTGTCAIFYALQIIFTGKFHEQKDDVIQLLTVELFVVGVLLSAVSLIFELPKYGIGAYALNGENVWQIIYLTLACTLYAQLAQLVGLKYTGANQASIILTLEAVFGVIFAIILGDEKITPILFAGFAVIFIGTLISELGADFGKIVRSKGKKGKEESANGEKSD